MGHSIRLLDAPLHEFFPHNSGLKQEENPMLGHRLVRMAITNPEIPEMQIKAILDAAAELISFLRNDADRFLPLYVDKEFPSSVHLHPPGSREDGPHVRQRRPRPKVFDAPKFEIFICGEHGGDVYTIGRLHEIGLTDVSMSPGKVYRSIIKAAQCQVTNPRKSVK